MRLLAVICLLGMAASAHGALDRTDWKWQQPVDLKGFSGFVRVPILPEIFDGSLATLDDLRVLDQDNNLVPHVIHWGRVAEKPQQEWQTARLLNKTFVPGEYARVTVDCGGAIEKNLITVTLPGENFRRRALLEGSNDGRSWERIAENLWLFDVRLEGQHFKVDTLKFPANNFHYLRLTVYNMADDPRRIPIEKVMVAQLRIENEKELVSVPVKQMKVTHPENKKHSLVELDCGFRNLPVVSLHLETATSYFFRGYDLFGRNETREKIARRTETGMEPVERKAPWRFVQRGVFYRVREKGKVGESLEVDRLHAPYRYLRMHIFNADNPPLQIDGVSVWRRDTSLVFEARPGNRYTLIGGNPEARPASYDLAKAVKDIDSLKWPLASLGPQTLLSAKQKEKVAPWTERHSAVIWALLILVGGVMALVILRSLKKLPPAREGP
jgi:hypothetical protein